MESKEAFFLSFVAQVNRQVPKKPILEARYPASLPLTNSNALEDDSFPIWGLFSEFSGASC